MRRKFQFIAFDFDGTIADSLECIVHSMQRSFVDQGYPAPEREAIRVQIGRPLERCMPDLLGRQLGAEDLAALVASYRSIYAEITRAELKLFPGISGLLGSLQQCSARMGIVTGKKSTVAVENCVQLGVRDYFETVIGSEHTVIHKPEAEPLLALLNAVKLPVNEDVVVVGDSVLDIAMGRAAGVPTIGVSWGANSAGELKEIGSTYVVDSVDELTHLLIDPSA